MNHRDTVFISVSVVLHLCCCNLWAQPTAFTCAVQPLDLAGLIVPEPIDLQAVRLEDQEREQQAGLYRFAVDRPVMITPETDGMCEEIDDEILLWRLPIASPQALSLSLGFTRFFLPPGGRLFIYSADHVQVLGPFTEDDNKEHGQLWTPLIHSDIIIVELTIPVSQVPQLELELTSINHGYRGFDAQPILMGLGDSADCNRNVACAEGDDWRDQIRSVARYHMTIAGYGTAWCTGSLVNNTAEDDKPYFLTAFHCFDIPRDGVLDDPNRVAYTMVVYWNYQASTCGGTWASDKQNQSGATFLAGYCRSDFALVELDDAPSRDFEVYYAGWDRSGGIPSSGTAIHHPQTDLKKISIENSRLYLDRWPADENPCPTSENTHLMVRDWDIGATEIASSGCPLFDQSKRIAGQLQGGTEEPCERPRVSLFGRFYTSWTGSGTEDTCLSDWLDPLKTGVMVLDGKNPLSPHCQTTQIGTGTSDWDYPMHTGYEDSRTEVLYLPGEVGPSGTIRALALNVTKVPGRTMKNWTIRMKQTYNAEFCSLDANGWTVVYRNDVTVDSTGWRWFEFQTPFEYNDTDALLVDFSHNNSSSSSHGKCRSYTRPWPLEESHSAYAHSDSLYGDPLNWAGTNRPSVRCSRMIPNVKLTICKRSTVVFEETFPSRTINTNNWDDLPRSGVLVDSPEDLPGPVTDYRLGLGRWDVITSKAMDLSSYASATLSYYCMANCLSDYEPLIEYWDGIEWREPPFPPPEDESKSPPDPGQKTHDLPSEAMHRDFKFRIGLVFREGPFSCDFDILWFVDDVKIEATYR